jgi:methionine-rich copper-binding protein CopC
MSGSAATKRMAIALSGLLLFSTVALSRDASAHAKLIRSRPKPFDLLALGPTHVDLWFNERLEDEFNAIEVVDASGHRVEEGAAEVNPGDRTNLRVRLGSLSPGSYVIHWRILSLDGHPARGRILFTVK